MCKNGRTEDQKMNWHDHTSNMDLSTAAFTAKHSGSGDVGWQ
jgi:hypothetical protein